MNFDLSDYYKQIIFSVLTILLGTLVKFIAQKIVNSFSHISHKADKRKNMIIKYIDIIIVHSTYFICSKFLRRNHVTI